MVFYSRALGLAWPALTHIDAQRKEWLSVPCYTAEPLNLSTSSCLGLSSRSLFLHSVCVCVCWKYISIYKVQKHNDSFPKYLAWGGTSWRGVRMILSVSCYKIGVNNDCEIEPPPMWHGLCWGWMFVCLLFEGCLPSMSSEMTPSLFFIVLQGQQILQGEMTACYWINWCCSFWLPFMFYPLWLLLMLINALISRVP